MESGRIMVSFSSRCMGMMIKVTAHACMPITTASVRSIAETLSHKGLLLVWVPLGLICNPHRNTCQTSFFFIPPNCWREAQHQIVDFEMQLDKTVFLYNYLRIVFRIRALYSRQLLLCKIINIKLMFGDKRSGHYRKIKGTGMPKLSNLDHH